MKTILKISMVCLLFILMGAGCGKEKIDYDPNSIIGKWEWIYTSGGFAGNTYPKEGDTVIWEFSKDSMLVRTLNGQTIFEAKFYVFGDTLKYFESTELTYQIQIKADTLNLLPVSMGPFSHTFKRIN